MLRTRASAVHFWQNTYKDTYKNTYKDTYKNTYKNETDKGRGLLHL